MIKRIIEKYKDWRFNLEWKRKHPDPLIVCPLWKNCAHVDGFLCAPHDCNMLHSHCESCLDSTGCKHTPPMPCEHIEGACEGCEDCGNSTREALAKMAKINVENPLDLEDNGYVPTEPLTSKESE